MEAAQPRLDDDDAASLASAMGFDSVVMTAYSHAPGAGTSTLVDEAGPTGGRHLQAVDPSPTNAGKRGVQPARLRALLTSLDLLAVTLAWVTAAWFGGDQTVSERGHLVAIPVLGLAYVALARTRGLYRAGVCSIRTVEVQRVGQVVILLCAATLAMGRISNLAIPNGEVVLGGLATFVLSIAFRARYRSWLAGARSRGRFRRDVVIVGTNDEAASLFELVNEHPQLGLVVVGVVGDDSRSRLPIDAPHLGPVSRTEELVKASGASGVLIAATDLTTDDLNRLTRNLLQAGFHVHLSTGLRGIAAHRLRPHSLAHEPVLYLEPFHHLTGWQVGAKRALDIVLGLIALVLSLPILAVAAVAIKLNDRGPIIFRQTRVGRGGKHFTMLKLRTMSIDAEDRYNGLAPSLAGRGGPLVKLRSDPRVTAVGRVLRATSIDELPQLINVLRGSMSLIGPRPNLLVEAERIDPGYLAHKCQVRPGMSGLWQVEARDNPSYALYKRLDVFYLDNWSMGLDLAILLVTLQRVVGRGARLLAGSISTPNGGC